MGAVLMLMAAPTLAFPSASAGDAVFPTAKIDAQLKPRFGDLIRPSVRAYGYQRPRWSRWSNFRYDGYYSGGQNAYSQPCDPADPYCQQPQPANDPSYGGYGRPDWAWRPGQDFNTYVAPPIYALSSGVQHITVDCRDTSQGYSRISEALAQLADGGTLHLKGRGPACAETLQINRPVIIAGDTAAAFPTEVDAGPATLIAPPGAPCAVIDAGPKGGVEFRDIVIEATQAGRAACLQTFSSAVALVRATVRYTGEGSAIYVQGGQLVLNDTEVDSASYDAAILSQDAAIALRNVGVIAASTGLDVRLGVGQGAFLNHVSITGSEGGAVGDTPMTAVVGRRVRGAEARFKIENVRLSGFRNGLVFERGLSVDVSQTRIGRSRMGIAVNGAVLKLDSTAIDAREYGVYVYSGEAQIADTSIFSVLRYPIGSDPGAIVREHGISLYSEGCGGFHHDAWSCRRPRDLPSYLLRDEDAGPRRWGWSW